MTNTVYDHTALLMFKGLRANGEEAVQGGAKLRMGFEAGVISDAPQNTGTDFINQDIWEQIIKLPLHRPL